MQFLGSVAKDKYSLLSVMSQSYIAALGVYGVQRTLGCPIHALKNFNT